VIGQFAIGGEQVRVDLGRGVCLAIPLDFGGPQPCHFGAAAATAAAMEAGEFVGSTRRGGSCNVPVISFNPHCNGTHTESVGHIVNEAVPVWEAVPGGLAAATLVTLSPVAAGDSGETYRPALRGSDWLLTSAALAAALPAGQPGWHEALVVRTLPNRPDKTTARYGVDRIPPFFSIEAVDYLDRLGVKHLLVDLPSVDRMHDEGLLTAHHRFWRVPEGTHQLVASTRQERTITEMIFVPDETPDGRYLLSLQVPAFCSDAAPSRPWLFPVEVER